MKNIVSNPRESITSSEDQSNITDPIGQEFSNGTLDSTNHKIEKKEPELPPNILSPYDIY
jgi:hypothetical protein